MKEHQINPIQHNLQHSLDATIGTSFDISVTPNVLQQLLEDKRSPNTRAAYEKDLKDFFKEMAGKLPTPDVVLEFLHLERGQAVSVVLKYKAALFKKGLSEATVNRRLAAVRALVAKGRALGIASFTLEDVKGEKVQKYRDTSGIDPETFKRVLAWCDRNTLQGKRDYALLRLLWGNALRRNEVSQLNIGDFDAEAKTLRILGKGKGTQIETIDLGDATVDAITLWLEASRGVQSGDAPLFTALDFHNSGHRLTGDGIRKIVVRLCEKAGIKKVMSPHRIRHSAITAALDATDGNVRKVQKLSRHRQLDTLMIYDDNRGKDQAEVTGLLDDMVF
jgi:integrase/recombinase XerC